MPHNTSISEFERQKQERIAIIKYLIRESLTLNKLYERDEVNEGVLSRLVKNILIEIDKV